MNEKFYNNKECKVLVDLGDDCVIEILVIDYYDVEDEYEEYARLIVPKKEVKNFKITKENIEKERDTILNSARKSAKEIIQKADVKMYEEKKKLKKELEELGKKISDKKHSLSNFEGLETYVDFLCGKIKYVIKRGYSWYTIHKLDECMCHGNNKYETNLASVSFRGGYNKGKTKMYLGQYSDYSGGNTEIEGFGTLEEAKKRLLELVEANENDINRNIKECDKWGITSGKIQTVKKEVAEKNKKIKEEEEKKLLEKLKRLRGNNESC